MSQNYASCLLKSIFVLLLAAATGIMSTTLYAQEDDLKLVCENRLPECLKLSQSRLRLEPAFSKAWYMAKLHEIETLFGLARLSELETALSPLEARNDLPLQLRLRAFIYIAKLNSEINPEKSLEYMEKAKAILYPLAKRSLHPRAMIDYANLQIYLKDYDEGIRILKIVELNFRHDADPDTKRKIYTNLGNLYFLKKDFDQSMVYHVLAEENARQIDNPSYHIMTVYNVARSHQAQGRDEEAIEQFKGVIDYAQRENDSVRNALGHFRIVELLLKNNRHTEAQKYINTIDASSLPEARRREFETMIAQ